MQIDDLPPFPRFVMSWAGTLFMVMGAGFQILAYCISIPLGIGVGTRHPDSRDAIILGGLLLLQTFGMIIQQFGFVILRGRLPVRKECLARWALYRAAWNWCGLILVPTGIGALILVVKLDWLALPLGAMAAICLSLGRHFVRLEDEWIVPKSVDSDGSNS
ncbi:MAG: hypothetical protein QM755_05760 [Luteolibacter sp.]